MDEATNSIDPKIEQGIAMFLLNEFNGAILWISHSRHTYGFELLRLDENND
jgi:ATPase subunit of ABC transporter with duplicated ATPase domains